MGEKRENMSYPKILIYKHEFRLYGQKSRFFHLKIKEDKKNTSLVFDHLKKQKLQKKEPLNIFI